MARGEQQEKRGGLAGRNAQAIMVACVHAYKHTPGRESFPALRPGREPSQAPKVVAKSFHRSKIVVNPTKHQSDDVTDDEMHIPGTQSHRQAMPSIQWCYA